MNFKISSTNKRVKTLDIGFHRRREQGTTDIAVCLMEDAQVNLRFLKHKKTRAFDMAIRTFVKLPVL